MEQNKISSSEVPAARFSVVNSDVVDVPSDVLLLRHDSGYQSSKAGLPVLVQNFLFR